MADTTSKLVTLSCPSHSEVLIDGLWKFFDTKYRVDVDVAWCGGSVSAHQLILDVFLPPENLTVRDSLTDQRCNLEAMLEFMYKGTVSIREEQLDKLLQVANQLDFRLLVDAVELARKSETQRLTRRQRKGNPSKLVPKYDKTSDHEGDDDEVSVSTKRRQMTGSRGRKRGRPPSESRLIAAADTTDEQMLLVDAQHPQNVEMSLLADGQDAQFILIDESGYFIQQEVPVSSAEIGADIDADVPKSKPVRLKKYVCETCGFRTKAPSNLVLHRRCHTGEKPFKCTTCSRSFADPSTWRRHLRRHLSDEKPYECEVCKKTFRRPDNLKAHLKTGHKLVKTVHCRICTFSSTVKGEVSEHVKTAHPEIKAEKGIGVRRCTCEMCGFSTETMAVLKRHQRCHSGEKPFVCHVCGLAYSDRTTLRRHVQRHLTDERSFVCHLCGKAFFRKDNLNAHLKNVHKSNVHLKNLRKIKTESAPTTEEFEQSMDVICVSLNQ